MIYQSLVNFFNYLFAITIPFSHVPGYIASGFGFLLMTRFLRKVYINKVFICMVIFLIYGLIRAFFSSEPKIGYHTMFCYFSHWLVPFTLGYGIVSKSNLRRIFGVYYFAFSILVFLSVLAYFGLFFPYIFKKEWHLVNEGLLKGLRSHIALGSLCLLFSFFSLGQAIFNKTLSKLKRIFFAIMTIFFMGCIFLTGSRGYYIAGFLTYLIFMIFWFVKIKKWKPMLLGASCVFLTLLILYFIFPNLRERIVRARKGDPSVKERITLYKVAILEIKSCPLFGFGPGQGARQKKFFELLPENERILYGGNYFHLHNFYLNLAADFGVVGLTTFLILMFLLMRNIWLTFFSASNNLQAIAFGLFFGIIGTLFGEIFDTLLRGPGVAMEIFWLSGLISSKFSNHI